LIELFSEGLDLFYKQQWDAAIAAMIESEKLEPNKHVAPKGMSPSRKIISYCEMFKANPPGPDWDGVTQLTSK
jgi:adenylate cyclase